MTCVNDLKAGGRSQMGRQRVGGSATTLMQLMDEEPIQVVLQYKYKGAAWSTDVTNFVIGASTNDATYRIGTPYTDRTKLGIRIRLVLQVQVGTGGSGVHRGTMNVSAAARYWCG